MRTVWYMAANKLRQIRESLLMSKSELAREANVSPITISRIEQGKPCRLETQRKIILALGFELQDKKKIFDKIRVNYDFLKKRSIGWIGYRVESY